MSRAVLYDSTLCVGCKACEGACAERWGLPYDEKIAAEEHLSAHKLTAIESHGERYSRRLCMHCEQPTCASVCPVGALQKTALGPVVYDAGKCMGCRYCMTACPFQVPSYEWSARLPKVRKCDQCYERQSKGQPTACTAACPDRRHHKRRPRRRWWPRRRSASPKSPISITDSIYGHQGGRRHTVLMLSAVPFEQIGLRTTLPQEPLPALTWNVLSHCARTWCRSAPCCSAASGGSPTAARKWPKTEGKPEEVMKQTQNHRMARDLRRPRAERACTRPTCGRVRPGRFDQPQRQISLGHLDWLRYAVRRRVGGRRLHPGGVVHIFNIEKYKPVLRPAILTAFLGYLLVVVALLFDLGRPDRLWHPLVMWNPHSVMFEVAWCVTLYSTVLAFWNLCRWCWKSSAGTSR